MPKIGKYTPPDENGKGELIEREWDGEGNIVKDYDAFYQAEDEGDKGTVVYIPEDDDDLYTYTDFLEIAEGNKEMASIMFHSVMWQHPETWLDENVVEGEIDRCEKCGKLFFCYDKRCCPNCHARYGEDIEEVPVTYNLRLTGEDIDDIMSAALDGGLTSMWCSKVDVIGEYFGEYASDQISRGGELAFHLIEPYEESGQDVYTLSLDKFLIGVQAYAKEPDDYCRPTLNKRGYLTLDIENVDNYVADAIVQYALFGDIVFR